jgi:PhoPQ-activated pathogenicity-related protein
MDIAPYGRCAGYVNTEQFDDYLAIDDPMSYFANSHLDKVSTYLVHANDDTFFYPDQASKYYPAVPGPKQIRYVGMEHYDIYNEPWGPEVIGGFLAWTKELLGQIANPVPKFEHDIDEATGRITVRVAEEGAGVPTSVKLWQSTNPLLRTFTSAFGAEWSSADLLPVDPGVYVAEIDAPRFGFSGFYVEVFFASGVEGGRAEEKEYKFTSAISVVPVGTYTFDACPTEICGCGDFEDCRA